MPTLLTFGDSNTHGTQPILTPGEMRRFDAQTRWPKVALGHLGPSWDLVEEGLPGRTTQFPDPIMGAEMEGQIGLKIALRSHGPIDVLTIMLGTNDLKTRFAPTPARITAGLAGLLDVALSDEMQDRHGGFKTLLISPPPILEQGPIAAQFFGGTAPSQALVDHAKALADARGVGFANAGETVRVSAQDGIHWDMDSHVEFGGIIAGKIKALAAQS